MQANLSALPESERRRSTRVLLVIPVEVVWTSKDGLQVQESAETEVVSKHGALLRMSTRLPSNVQVELRRPASGQKAKARVVGAGNPSPDGLARVAVELDAPCDTFWGVSFPNLAAAPQGKSPASPASGKTPVTAGRR
jgi:hypothetical protein